MARDVPERSEDVARPVTGPVTHGRPVGPHRDTSVSWCGVVGSRSSTQSTDGGRSAIGWIVCSQYLKEGDTGVGCEVCSSAVMRCAGSTQERAQLSNGPAGSTVCVAVIGGRRVPVLPGVCKTKTREEGFPLLFSL